MRQLFIHICTTLLLVIIFATPVMAAKIKHLSTLYVDSAGVGLNHPEGVACSDNSLIVADTGNSQVVQFSISAQGVIPKAVFPVPDSSLLIAELDSKGNVYLLDGKSRSIIKLDQQGQVAGKVEPKGLPAPKDFIPRSFTFDKDDNLYLLDILSGRVLVLNSAAEFLRQYPFPEGAGFFSDLAVSPQGTIYLLDSVAGAIYTLSSGGETFELLSQGLKEYMNFPTNLAIDSKGTLYLSDQYGSGLVLVGRDGSFQGRKFGMGWEDGQFYYPAQVCISPQDTLVVADRNNNRVQVFTILDE
jgi:DNA-binding beta-propeller fold protein YncE